MFERGAVRRRLPIVMLLVAGFVSSCGGGGDGGASSGNAPATAAADQLELGKKVYATNCARCHGRNGGGSVGPKLDDGRVVERYPDAADHRQVVVDGRGGMPAWGDKLSDEEIDAVVRYEREGLQ